VRIETPWPTRERSIPGITRRRAVGTLLLVVFIDLLGFEILIPVIPMPNVSVATSSSGVC
jgi:hypothetical protein